MNIWIVEDEEAACRRLQKLINEVDPSLKVVKTLDSILSVLEAYESDNEPDLVFMDINLADGLSFEIFKHIQLETPIIFTTAYDQYTLQAFKVNTLDYLLKPIKKDELNFALEKFRKWNTKPDLQYEKWTSLVKEFYTPQRFLIKIGKKYNLIDIKQVAYFYTEHKITFLATWNGKKYPIDYSLEQLESILQSKNFFRVNRQFVIHVKSIFEMASHSKSRIQLELEPRYPEKIVVSTDRAPLFKKWLTGDNQT